MWRCLGKHVRVTAIRRLITRQ
jgi:hypothetical protein